jgi:hypothetical protein
MAPKKEIAPELLAEARRLYEQTPTPVDDIAGMLGLSRASVARRARAGGWQTRRARSATLQRAPAADGGAAAAAEPDEPPRPEIVVGEEPASPQQRMALALRIQRVVEQEMDAVERILKAIAPSDQVEAEHGARTLASVSRTLREIRALNVPAQETAPDAADDDPIPRDIDEFRRELTRRIRGFIEARRRGAGELPDQRESKLG